MTAQEGDTSLERLSREECLQLLSTVSVGRVAVAEPGGPPLVVPVNYVVDGDVIVFRSDPGSKLDALREHPASFQVDLIDPFHRTGWSVLVQGVAYETSPAQVNVEPWDRGPKAHWVRIFPGAISGRRLRLPEVPPDPRGYL
jgi:nitroimidazol reductase NimA-like FMN-containing flavoprotein (pyridoxamine 5'-phosphate oxidase superfamily)